MSNNENKVIRKWKKEKHYLSISKGLVEEVIVELGFEKLVKFCERATSITHSKNKGRKVLEMEDK